MQKLRDHSGTNRIGGVHRDATLIVIASEDRYAVKQYFELFKSTQIQFRVLETTPFDESHLTLA